MTADDQDGASEPVLRVVNPDATAEEIAALVAVFSAMGSGAAQAPKPRSAWASVERRLRPLPPHGVGAWMASGLPR